MCGAHFSLSIVRFNKLFLATRKLGNLLPVLLKTFNIQVSIHVKILTVFVAIRIYKYAESTA